jgi:hypothetical protein
MQVSRATAEGFESPTLGLSDGRRQAESMGFGPYRLRLAPSDAHLLTCQGVCGKMTANRERKGQELVVNKQKQNFTPREQIVLHFIKAADLIDNLDEDDYELRDAINRFYDEVIDPLQYEVAGVLELEQYANHGTGFDN